MRKRVLIGITLLLTSSIYGQTTERANQKGKWFFGLELGLNNITSSYPQEDVSLQGGILAEYYFAKQWAVSARIKYLKTGVTHDGIFSKGTFEGAIISIPLNIKWEYRITPKLNGNLKIGMALNQEVKSNYNYPEGAVTDFDTFYTSFNPGLGFNYFIAENTAIYVGYEYYLLGNDRGGGNWLIIVPNSPENGLFNIGIKHSFK